MTLDDIRQLTPFEGKLCMHASNNQPLSHLTDSTLEGTVMAVQAPDGTELKAEYVRWLIVYLHDMMCTSGLGMSHCLSNSILLRGTFTVSTKCMSTCIIMLLNRLYM